ncbi:MAG: ferrochelatase [Ilumatobacteraceae bacterium]
MTRTGVVVMAYGTPRTPAEILPYYTDIRRGRPPTDEQLADLVRRYDAIGGISPLAARTEAQRDAIAAALGESHRVVLGLKHADPKIEAAVDELAARGVEHVVGLVLAPQYSAFSVGEYLGRMTAAAERHGMRADGVRSWATEPAFVDFVAANVRSKLATMPPGTFALFTAHSLPSRIVDAGDPYPDELRATAAAVAERAGIGDDRWGTAWQSAGRTPEPWLGPDVLDAIDGLAAEGRPGVLVGAVGFVADHLEVRYDLDIEARRRATDRGIAFERTACVNDDPAVMAALARRIAEMA